MCGQVEQGGWANQQTEHGQSGREIAGRENRQGRQDDRAGWTGQYSTAAKGRGKSGHFLPYLPAATPLHSPLRHPAAKDWGNSGHFLPYLLMCGQVEQGGWANQQTEHGQSGREIAGRENRQGRQDDRAGWTGQYSTAAKGRGNSGHFLPYLSGTPPLHSTLRHPAAKGQGNSGRFRPYLLMCGQVEQGGWANQQTEHGQSGREIAGRENRQGRQDDRAR